MHRYIFAATLALAACSTSAQQAAHPLAGKTISPIDPPAAGQVDLPRFPSISPDGQDLCFSWRGDLWRVPAAGGQATRLTAHPTNEDLSIWSPDGKHIAFNSTRYGYRNVYRMNADGTDLKTVTREDRSIFISDWTNQDTLAVSSSREADIYKSPRVYSVSINGGPITRLHDAFGRAAVVSPDGRHVAFVRGRGSWIRPFLTNSDSRDLWVYDRQEQSFRKITENPGHDGKPKWIDNNTLAYLSARPPARVNLYRIGIDQDESQAVALTAFDEDIQSFDIARNGTTVVMHVWDKLYTMDLRNTDEAPAPVSITAPADASDTTLVQELAGNTNQVALSPDGKVAAMSIRGELFIRTVGSQNPPQRITRHIALDEHPTWSADGQKLYFTSDRDGTLSIYEATVSLTRSDIESSLKPEESETGKNVEVEDVKEEESNASPSESDAGKADEEEAAGVEDLDTPEETKKEKEADKNPADRWHDAIRFDIAPAVQSANHDTDPSPSPDGKSLAFRRGNGTIMIRDLETGEDRVFREGWDSRTHWSWSGDGRFIAVASADQDHNTDIWVGPADSSAPLTNISKHPAADLLPSFSSDGKILTFVSARQDRQYDVYAVYLDKSLESLTPQQLDDYYKKAASAAKKIKPLRAKAPEAKDPAKKEDTDADADADEKTNEESDSKENLDEAVLDLDDAYLRLRRLTSTSDTEWNATVLPGGDRVVFSRSGSVYTVGWDGSDEKKVGDRLNPQHISLTGTHLAATRGGSAVVVPIKGGEAETVEVTGSIVVDRRLLQKQRFEECARAITMGFYDGSFKGIDWPGATRKYEQLASRAWTASEFDDIANRYLGLLEASHMGIRSPSPTPDNRQANGRLGATYEWTGAGYKVVSTHPDTPAAQGEMRLQLGDVLIAIDFEPIKPSDTVAARLSGRVGRETAVTVLRQKQGQDELAEQHLLITPISYRAFDSIRYDHWQLANLALVEKLSEGRLGYIHIESMNATSLAEFERDLYAACEGKEGMVIDVRDNGGGWTTDRLLASIMTRRHAYTVPRDADPDRTNSYPIDRLFITRYNLPMNALCNEHSFSNAEIFSHAFKTLDRGTLVGNTTAGGVISTGQASLLDGTTIRMPFRGWYLPDGTDMENNGAVPDLLIPQSPDDEATGRDRQLEAAVADLLKRL